MANIRLLRRLCDDPARAEKVKQGTDKGSAMMSTLLWVILWIVCYENFDAIFLLVDVF